MSQRVLYIDDDEGLTRLIQKALGRRGFDVTGVNSADAGLARLTSESFDVVALDHTMPGRGGLETLAELMALPNAPPVVYVTGSDDARVAIAALKAGASDYVIKSIGEDFFDLLASSLRNSLERQALIRARITAENELRASNERLAALVREANHRVANSLQIVSSFIQFQANAVSAAEARTALKDTHQRVQAISRLHRRLYTTEDIKTIELREYLRTVLSDLEAAWSTEAAPRPIHFNAEPIRLRTDHAISVGVVVNELVSNACKYAYAENQPGEIRVTLHRNESGFGVAIEDDGVGFTDGVMPRGTGIGTKLVDAMARSLSATIAYATDDGARVLLTVPHCE